MTSPTPAPRVTNAHDWAHKRTPDVRRPWWRRALPLTIAIVLTLALCVASVLIGVADLRSEEGRGIEFLWLTRIPRTAALVLAGASLALAGLVMQLMTQNRFVEPSTVGTTEWAGLGLLLTYAFWPTASVMLKMAVAIVFAFIGTMIFFTFLRRVTLKSSLIVPIVGIMFGAVIGAVSTFLALQLDLLQVVGAWFQGRFGGVETGRYEPLYIVAVVAIVIFIIADRFTVAGLGKEVATNVGLNYERIDGRRHCRDREPALHRVDRAEPGVDDPRRQPPHEHPVGVPRRHLGGHGLRHHRSRRDHALRGARLGGARRRRCSRVHHDAALAEEALECLVSLPRSRPRRGARAHSSARSIVAATTRF
jgi:iron complex transport system permease protein